MHLALGRHIDARDVARLVRRHDIEFDLGTGLGVIDGKARQLHLLTNGLLQIGMAPVDDDAVTRNVNGREIREAHEVVPLQMGDKDVVSLRMRDAEAGDFRLAKRAGAAAHVADEMIVAVADDFDT